MRTRLCAFCWFAALMCGLPDVNAGEQITVVVGRDAPELERFAAAELQDQFQRLFDAEVEIAHALPGGGEESAVVLIGSPATNRAVAEAVGDSWPELSDQGHLLRSLSGDSIVVGGGSPVATLWAVYELGHHFGVRYLTRQDIFPDPQELDLSGIDRVLEPTLRTRSWRTVNDFVIGPESWGLADQEMLLQQLAKLKFNRVILSFWPWQPFVHYEFGGVRKSTAMLWFGDRFRVDGDIPGKTVFGGKTYFTNPEFEGKESYEEMHAAGVALARGIMDEAHRLGMSVGISMQPAQFPREFADALPGLTKAHQLKSLTVAPGGAQGPDDPAIRGLVKAKLRAYIETYPTVDVMVIGMPEFPEWDAHVETSWQQLNSDGRLGDLTLESVIDAARQRKVIVSGDRGVRAIRGNIVPLAFFQSLFADPELLERPAGGHVELVIRSIDTALYPVVDRVVPDGAGTLNFIDYTSRRSADNVELMQPLPADKVNSSLIFTLADDNVGILSQSVTQSIHELVVALRENGWDGFSTRYWMLAEMDPTLHYLSRASFDDSVTPRSAHDDLFLAITGNEATSDRLWRAMEHIEAATDLFDKQAIGFGFPVEGMFMKHYQAQENPAWWDEAKEHYLQAMIEFYRARGNAHGQSRELLMYYAKRGGYVLEYLAAVEAVREAAVAREAGDRELAIEKLEASVESLYNAIDTLSDVVWDQSDRGLIATLTNFAYRPLVAEYERMLAEQ